MENANSKKEQEKKSVWNVNRDMRRNRSGDRKKRR